MGDAILDNLDILVKDNIRILKIPNKRFASPLAVIFVGVPFSGKTTLATHLSKQLPVVLLSEENMASFLAPRATFFKRGAEEIFMLASRTIEELIKQKISLVYDSSIKKFSDRALLRKLVSEAGGRLAVVSLALPEDEAYRKLEKVNMQIVRGDKKGFIMNRDLFRYELNSIEKPSMEEQPIICNVLQSESKDILTDTMRSLLGAQIST